MSENNKALIRNYEEYTTARGELIKIYPVSTQILAGLKPDRSKPKRPKVEMKTKGGIQKRWMKKGDDGWEEYQDDLENWDQEKGKLEDDVGLVLALKDYKIPDPLKFSAEIEDLVDAGMLDLPENDYSRDAMWLRDNAVGQYDEHMINMALQRLAGVPDEVVDVMIERFRNILSGTAIDRVEEQIGEIFEAEGDDQE